MTSTHDAITANNQTFMAAFKRRDAAAIAALYTSSARLLPPDADMAQGREAIQSFWQGTMDMGVRQVELNTIDVEQEGSLACEVGRFRLTVAAADGKTTEVLGKYVVVWRRDGDEWRLHVDIWNGNSAQ